MNLNKEELLFIKGGASVSGTLINAFVKLGTLIYDIAKSLGSSLRRITTKSIC